MITKIDRFTADGTFTVPAGVTYAIAHIRGGGGGVGTASSGAGGTSSVAFAGGTVSATGGAAINNPGGASWTSAVAPPANSGFGAFIMGNPGTTFNYSPMTSLDGAYIVAGGAVTAGVGITVTVGAGGVAGTNVGAAGAAGYVWIEYQVTA
jgi:hypothetical protein